MKEVVIYTDGGCKSNPGPGGYGVVLLYGRHRRECAGGFRLTTNNRMEILAAIIGLTSLTEPCKVLVLSDSRYLVDAVGKGWLDKWKSTGWRTADRKPVKNVDLWQRLLPLLDRHEVNFRWVRGHVGTVENERCDQLANEAISTGNLEIDRIFELGDQDGAFPTQLTLT